MLIKEGIEESDMGMMEADILPCYSNKDGGGGVEPRSSKTWNSAEAGKMACYL